MHFCLRRPSRNANNPLDYNYTPIYVFVYPSNANAVIKTTRVTFFKSSFQKQNNVPGFEKRPILCSSPTEFAVMRQNVRKSSNPGHLVVDQFKGIRETPKACVCWSESCVMSQHLTTAATVSGGAICSNIVCGSIARQTF